MNVRLAALFCLFPLMLSAQGFSGLGTQAEGFATPRPGAEFQFPRDHGPHPDYRIEWWYLTANLEADDGTQYGLQWTLFRSALEPVEGEGWASPQIWFGHAAVTTPEQHFATERFARGGIGQAGVETQPFRAWIDEWTLEGPDFDTLALSAQGPEFGYDMELEARGPLIFHGDQGYSVKSAEGQASYYYSQPFFHIAGRLRLPGQDIEVSGSAWLDREWSSQPLSETQTGWDWFSLSFDDGDKLMGFQLRQSDGEDFSASTWINADGQTTAFPDGSFSATPGGTADVGGREIPVEWHVRLPERGVDVMVRALTAQAWMDLTIPYWEGPVILEGTHSGVGYLEMTGYE